MIAQPHLKQQPSCPPSMDTVAAAAGVATSTVSRALKGDPRIREATRLRILELAEQLGYRPNPLVSALMAQLRHNHPPVAQCNLAWLDFFRNPDDWRQDPVQEAFYEGACRHAKRAGYAISRIRCYNRSSDSLARSLRNRGIKGVLLPDFDESQGRSTKVPLPLDEFTIVSVGTRYEQPSLHYSSDDQYECGRLAVLTLWERGYRRIGYVGDPRVEKIVNRRFLAGYLTTLQNELSGSALPPLITDDDERAVDWLKETKAEAIVSANRLIFSALRTRGIRMPEDVALAHLNLADVADANPGEVAGIRQDNTGVGANAIELLVNLLYANEVGVPIHPRGIQIHGAWIDGATVPEKK